MLWTAEAIENSQKAGSRRKKRERHRRGARRGVPQRRDRQGEPDRDQAQRRRARLCARRDAGWRVSGAIAAIPRPKPVPASRAPPPPVSREAGEKGGMDLCRSRGRRDATGEVRGNPRIRLPMAARRSEERGFRLLRAQAGRGPLLLRRPLPDGLSPARRRGKARRSGEGPAHSRIRGGRPERRRSRQCASADA